MAYKAKEIANLFIDVAHEGGEQLDQMKLQKLVYIAHGWHLAIDKKPLLSDNIQAWQYGPVIPVLYDEFKNYGSNPITDHATEIKINPDTLTVDFSKPEVDKNDTHTIALVRKIWEVYGKYSGGQLSNLTHLPNTPWDETYKMCPQGAISNELIKKHFDNLAKV